MFALGRGFFARYKPSIADPPEMARLSVCIVLFTLLLPPPALGQEARLNNIVITNTRDDLLVYLNVNGAFRGGMKSAILSGVPTRFSFFISLHRVRAFWLDKKITSLKVTHEVKYDNLKKVFTVRRSWENGKQHEVKTFAEARTLMTDIDSLKITALDQIEKGRQYQLRAKAKLNKVTLPLHLHYVLFFVSLWDFETDWYSIDFIYCIRIASSSPLRLVSVSELYLRAT